MGKPRHLSSVLAGSDRFVATIVEVRVLTEASLAVHDELTELSPLGEAAWAGRGRPVVSCVKH